MLVRPVIGYIGAIVLLIRAVLSKENAVTLPLTIILGEIAFFRISGKQILLKNRASLTRQNCGAILPCFGGTR